MIAGRYLGGRCCRGLLFLGILAVISGGAISWAAAPEQAQPVADKETPTPFAVVELFTSESCPTCPAADRLLSEMGTEARKTGQRILPLAFHVDYWRTGSAADPFSDTAFARRQRTYADALSTEDVYTPQMVVNGRVEFVGHQRATAERQIKAALNRPATASVKLALEEPRPSTGSLQISCDVSAPASGTNLQIAVVERNPASPYGSRRPVDNVVRVFKTVPLSKGGSQTVELQLPRDLVRKNASVVGYVQDSRSLAILGATSIEVEASPVQRVASAR